MQCCAPRRSIWGGPWTARALAVGMSATPARPPRGDRGRGARLPDGPDLRARQFSRADFDQFDLILAMDRQQPARHHGFAPGWCHSHCGAVSGPRPRHKPRHSRPVLYGRVCGGFPDDRNRGRGVGQARGLTGHRLSARRNTVQPVPRKRGSAPRKRCRARFSTSGRAGLHQGLKKKRAARRCSERVRVLCATLSIQRHSAHVA